jgi:hypothetical protein
MAHLDLDDIDDGAILVVLHHAGVSFPSATADSTMMLKKFTWIQTKVYFFCERQSARLCYPKRPS